MVKYHFYYPRRIDVIGDTLFISETQARKQCMITRKWVHQWELARFFALDEKNGIYIFGKTTPKELVTTISHEIIHHTIKRIVGLYVSCQLDNIDDSLWCP